MNIIYNLGKLRYVETHVNDFVMIKLTDRGREIHRQGWERLWGPVGELRRSTGHAPTYIPPVEDINGWSRWQIWVFLQEFGPHIRLGGPTLFAGDLRFLPDR